MTKLYCPKGHAGLYEDNLHYDRLGTAHEMFICNNLDCYRSYFKIDCLTEPKKEKRVNLQDIVPPLKVASILFIDEKDSNSVESHQIRNGEIIPSDLQWVNPKRESQIAIDRVVQALDKIANYKSIDILTNGQLLDLVIGELENEKKFDEVGN